MGSDYTLHYSSDIKCHLIAILRFKEYVLPLTFELHNRNILVYRGNGECVNRFIHVTSTQSVFSLGFSLLLLPRWPCFSGQVSCHILPAGGNRDHTFITDRFLWPTPRSRTCSFGQVWIPLTRSIIIIHNGLCRDFMLYFFKGREVSQAQNAHY